MKLIRVHLSGAAASSFRSPISIRFIPFYSITRHQCPCSSFVVSVTMRTSDAPHESLHMGSFWSNTFMVMNRMDCSSIGNAITMPLSAN